jgi:hypothetical protein
MKRMLRCGLAALLCLLLGTAVGQAQEVSSLLLQIKGVGKEGKGNVEAIKAWNAVVDKGQKVLPDVLTAFSDANPVAVNWLRAAAESILDGALASDQRVLPDTVAKLESFLQDTKQSPRARRLAYECLVRVDPTTSDRWLSKFLDDPGQELRRDAVEVILKDAGKLLEAKDDKALGAYKKVLQHARDRDQIKTVAESLKKLGQPIDLTSHFNFVTQWQVVGPFDNAKGVGFSTVYPPEKGVDLKATYTSKDKEEIRWKPVASKKELGLVDLNEEIGKLKGAVGYGFAVVESATERPIDLRAGSNNAVRMWLNGKEVYFREEYHHGMEMDQHIGSGVLKAGRNEILIKVCQNEQTETWAQLWSFQLRVCDPLGAAVPLKVAAAK